MTGIVCAYAVIYLVWGSTYFFIKCAVQTIPPFYVVGIRFFIGGILLLSIAFYRGSFCKIPSKREILSSIAIGVLLLIGGNGLVTIAEKNVDSYLTALIIATTPIVVLIIDRVLLRKPVPVMGALGSVIGIVGVALLLFDGSGSLQGVSVQILMLFCAIFFWGLGTSLSKKLEIPKDSLINSGIQLFSVGVIATAAVQFFQPVPEVPWTVVTAESWGALLVLTIFGSLALYSYSYLLKHEPNHRVVSYALVNPVIAVFVGVSIGKETSVPFLIPGMVCILLGLFCMLYGEVILRCLSGKK